MGSWDFKQVGVVAKDKNVNMKLIDKVMDCFGIIKLEEGFWLSQVGVINHCEFDTQRCKYCFADSYIKTYDLFCILNTLSGKINLYCETEAYISTCDSHYRYEEIYDSKK